MKRKFLVSALTLVLIIGMFAGCSKREVDYSIDGDIATDTESLEASVEINDDSLEQFRNETVWKDTWSVTDKYATKRNIRIEATVAVPDLKNMRVIESQPLSKDEEFKKQCLDSFFGTDAEYYYHEEENYTREELEKWLPDEVEMIENASDSRMVAEEFESVSHYAAYRNEILYEITLTDARVSIQPNWDDENKCGPEEFRNYKQVDMYEDYLQGAENKCKYSQNEAREIADNYMKEIGMSAMECTVSTSLTWRGNNTEIYDDNSADEYLNYGYIFEYATGIDGVSFAQFPEPYMFMTSYESAVPREERIDVYGGDIYHPQEGGSVGNGKVRILVTDDGISSVSVDNAEVIGTVSNSVGLLPLDTVKEIFEKEIAERTAKYDIHGFFTYNYLELIYLKIGDDTQKMVMAVPVWCLSWKDGNIREHPVFVNAIDGSIVHFADAEWAGVEALPEQLESRGMNED